MIHYVTIDTNRFADPHLYDSRTNSYTPVSFNGARSFLLEYINKLKLHPISIYESYLPNRTQIVCWYTIKQQEPTPIHAPITRPAQAESIVEPTIKTRRNAIKDARAWE